VPVRERQQFGEAIRTKIIREIAGFGDVPRVHLAQSEPPMDCSNRQAWRSYGP
jgi:hypothetical protein